MPNPTCPFAKQRLLARAASKPVIHPTASAAHTAVTSANGQQLGDFFEKADADAHFYIDHDASLWQYLPVDRKSWAQYSGNGHVVAYETWDGGNPATPWTPQQMTTIAKLLAWLYRTWDIPLDISTTATGPGVGWHSKYPAWNRDGHQCPGATRVGQLVQEVLPAAHKLVDMPPPPAPPEDDLMRDERIIVVPAPDAQGRQLVGHDKAGAELGIDNVTSSVQVKASNQGVITPLLVQPYAYGDKLALSVAKLDGSPAPAGAEARIVIEHR